MASVYTSAIDAVSTILEERFNTRRDGSRYNRFELINMYKVNPFDKSYIVGLELPSGNEKDIEIFKCRLENTFEIFQNEFMRCVNTEYFLVSRCLNIIL